MAKSFPIRRGKTLAGKTALITGAARAWVGFGIGPGGSRTDVANNFSRLGPRSAGDRGRSVRLGVRAFALRCDVTEEASVKSMMSEAGRQLGRLDILVNNAANYERLHSKKLTVRQWDRIFASNTRGPFLVSVKP